MGKINYAVEKDVIILYKHLCKKTSVNEPVSGAVLNLLTSKFFTQKNATIRGVDLSYCIHSSMLHNKQISIKAPIISRTPNIKGRIYNPNMESLYFLSSFCDSNITLPQNIAFKENKGMNDVFNYYYLDGKNIPNGVFESLIFKISNIWPVKKNHNMLINETKEKIDAISEFYQNLLNENSTTEGTFVLINILLLLFNSEELAKTIDDKQISKIQTDLFEELQYFSDNNEHDLNTIDVDFKDDSGKIIFSLLEFRILNGFCKAFNCMSVENKITIKNIFNEKSQNRV